jgi:hypothetical protein
MGRDGNVHRLTTDVVDGRLLQFGRASNFSRQIRHNTRYLYHSAFLLGRNTHKFIQNTDSHTHRILQKIFPSFLSGTSVQPTVFSNDRLFLPVPLVVMDETSRLYGGRHVIS